MQFCEILEILKCLLQIGFQRLQCISYSVLLAISVIISIIISTISVIISYSVLLVISVIFFIIIIS